MPGVPEEAWHHAKGRARMTGALTTIYEQACYRPVYKPAMTVGLEAPLVSSMNSP